MLRNIKDLRGYAIRATDGVIGKAVNCGARRVRLPLDEGFDVLLANAPAVEMAQHPSRRMRRFTGSRDRLAPPLFSRWASE